MTHWQHKALTREAVSEAILLRGSDLNQGHVKFLSWVRAHGHPVTTGRVAQDYYQSKFGDPGYPHNFQRAKEMLESLALNGYLLRGRSTGKSTHPKSGGKFTVTTYRCSLKARKLLAAQVVQ